MTQDDFGSYDPDAGPERLAGEVARLEAQAALSWAEEFIVLDRLISGPAPNILEAGCGSGAITARLVSAWPGAAVTALEPDPRLLAVAAERLAGRGIHWVAGTAEHNNLPEGGFDLIVLRYVLQHLSDPVAAVRALATRLAPGGRLVAIEVDGGLWGAADPTEPDLAPIHAAAGRRRQGGDRLAGRRLWRILRDAGLAEVRLEPFCYHSGDLGLEAFEPQLDPGRLLPAVGAGEISFADYLRLAEAHRRFMRTPDAFVMMLGFAAHGARV